MPILRGASRATVFALTLGLAIGGTYIPGEREAQAQRTRPLTKKERQKRKEQEEAAKKEQEKKDQEAAAAAEDEEKKKKAAAAAAPPPPPPEKKEEFDDTVEAKKAVFVTAELGYTRADLSTLAASSMAFDKGSASGVLLGLTGGVRMNQMMYGLKYRVYDASTFTLWSFSASVAYVMKQRPLAPIIEGHLGYIFDQSIERDVFERSLPEGTILAPDVDVKGLLLGGEASGNYTLTTWFRVGAFFGFDFMFLSRARAPLPQSSFGPTDDVATLPLYHDSGFGIGLNINLGLRGTFEIGIE